LTPAAVPPTITLTGGGTITLAGGTLTGVQNNQGGRTALINVNNTIAGTGTITSLALTNRANINANVAGSDLRISNFSITNQGTLQASNGGSLTLASGGIGLNQITNQPNGAGQGGSIFAGAGSTVNLNGVGITGGFLDTQGTGTINGTGAVGLVNLTVNGTYNVGAGTTTGISGQVRNNGSINVPAGGTLKGSNLINGNKVVAAAGASVALADLTQTDGSLVADGSFQTPVFDIEGGMLIGTGTVTGAVTIAGTFQPGDYAPGFFNVQGLYDQTITGTLDELIGGTVPGQFSQTDIMGMSSLNGLLEVNLFDGFQPSASDVFAIMESTSGFAGYFANAIPTTPGGPGLLQYSGGTFDVNYNVDYNGVLAVTLSNFTPTATPEPASSLMIGSALIGFSLILRRRLPSANPRSQRPE
jgi:hypothetical protein